jgi:hypothetical protein
MFHHLGIWVLVASLILSVASSRSQEPRAKLEQQMFAGLRVDAVLKTDLSSKYSKVGDPVELEVVHPALDNPFGGMHYQSLLADHTRLRGTVTMVRRAEKGQTAAVAIRVAEARLKSEASPLDGILASPVLVSHGWGKFTDERGAHDYNSVRIGEEFSPLDDASVEKDTTFGSVLSSKHNFFLVKNQARLVIVIR